MDTRQIEYILAINRCKSVSRAAEELFLTQSALNQQLLKLEKELGAPLFVRTRSHWQLTEVGALYVENAERILDIKKQTYARIQDLAGKWNSTVTIGLTPERGAQMFTAIYPQMHAKYPETTFQPIEASVSHQVELLETGKLDICFQTIASRRYKNLVYDGIASEPFYLCVPRAHPLAARGGVFGQEPYPYIALQEFRGDLFTLVKRSSNMRAVLDQLFEDAGFQPRLLFESTSMHSMQQLTADGQCCAIIPRYYAAASEKVVYFSLGPKAGWEIAAVHARSHYLNSAARDFLRMGIEYWQRDAYLP